MQDQDIIWIEEAVTTYNRSRAWLNEQIAAGRLSTAKIAGDKRVYLLRSELDALLRPQIEKRAQTDAG